MTDWLTNINPVFEDLDETNKPSDNPYEKYNYCKYGHYEEFDIDDPSWPECKNEAFHLMPEDSCS